MAAAGAEARLRATLDDLGTSAGDLDSLVVAHASEVAAKDSEIVALGSELRSTRTYAEQLVAALDATTAEASALRAENSALRLQVDAWNRVANPPLLLRAAKELGKVAIYGGGGYVAGRLGL